jgi:DNA-binding LytR/AlgR family response regulator
MKILIIEDEKAAAQRLQKLIEEVEPGAELIAVLDSIEAAVAWFRTEKSPDLVFADIHLADGSSFEIFKEVEVEVPLIFTTAYDQYAIDAFKLNSVDYLLKPIKREELTHSFAKFRKVHTAAEPAEPGIDYARLALALRQEKQDFQKRIVIRYGQHIKAVEIADIAYFYIDSKITLLRTFEGKNSPVDYNMDQLEEILNPSEFFRINRSCIVNIRAIDKMFAYSKSRVKIEMNPAHDQETIVSSERSALFKEWLKGG